MADLRQSAGLPTIFGIFLGLMVTAFIGVGVYTYYPSPAERHSERIRELNRQQQAIAASKAPEALTADDRARMQALTDERDGLLDDNHEAARGWGLRTSMILIALATLTMAVPLAAAPQVPVIGNGLLLGGVFTMIYGVGWIVTTETSGARFAVITGALLITLAMGYVRFVRGAPRGQAAAMADTGPVNGALEARIRRLETRLDEAARALRPRDPS